MATAELPDGRNYEIVSPPESAVNVGGPIVGPVVALQVSTDGRRILYPNLYPLSGSATGLINSYVAERQGDGWNSQPLSAAMPLEIVDGSNGPAAFSIGEMFIGGNGNLDGLISRSMSSLAPEAQRQSVFSGDSFDLYLHRLGVSGPTWISQSLTLPATEANKAELEGVNDVGSGVHIVYRSPEPEDPNFPSVNEGLYEWSEGDTHPHLISLDEAENPVAAQLAVQGEVQHAISPDGRRVVFKSEGGLFVRVGDSTIDIASGVGARYEGASADTSRIFFSALNPPPGVSAPAGPALYVYNVPADGDPNNGQVEYITSYEGGYLAAIPASGRHAYYVDATSGRPQLFDFDVETGTRRYVATLSEADQLWDPTAALRQIRVSPDGETVAFVSSASGIGVEPYDNGGFRQVFAYHSGPNARPQCISCRPDGAVSTSDAVLKYFGTKLTPTSMAPAAWRLTRNVSDSGRVFFQTADSLVPQDEGSNVDVYEWVDGHAELISSGKRGDAYFLDASVSGDDVYFTSFDALDPRHQSGFEAIYDARVGAPPLSAPQADACSGEGCQLTQGSPSTWSGPASRSWVNRHSAPGQAGRKLQRELRSCRRRHKGHESMRKKCESQAKRRYHDTVSKQRSTIGRVK